MSIWHEAEFLVFTGKGAVAKQSYLSTLFFQYKQCWFKVFWKTSLIDDEETVEK